MHLTFLLILALVAGARSEDSSAQNDPVPGLSEVMMEEEMQAVLRKYDIDDSGDLDKHELALAHDEITKVAEKLLKKLQPGTKAEDDSRTRETPDKKADVGDASTNYLLMTLLIGGAGLVVYLITTRRRPEPAVSAETEIAMRKRRDEWLDRMSNRSAERQASTPGQTPSTNRSARSVATSRPTIQNEQTLESSKLHPSKEQHLDSPIDAKERLETDTSDITSGVLYGRSKTNLEESSEADLQTASEQAASKTSDQESQNEQSKKKDVSFLDKTHVPCETSGQGSGSQLQDIDMAVTDKTKTSGQGSGSQLQDIDMAVADKTKTSVQESDAQSKDEDKSDLDNVDPSSKTSTQDFDAQSKDRDVPDKPTKDTSPTTDKGSLLHFLSNVLSCSITVADVKTSKYSLGKLSVREKDVPETTDRVAPLLNDIVLKILPRQISKVKYAVKCFTACEEYSVNYNDTLVTAAKSWLCDYCVHVILTGLKTESNASNEEDLWSDFDSQHHTSESVDFLWRVAGWAEDGVDVSSSLLSQLLQYQETTSASPQNNSAVSLVTVLLQGAGHQLSRVKSMDEVILSEGRTLRALEILLTHPQVGAVLSVALEEEAAAAIQGLGNYFEKASMFGPLLSVSTVPTKLLQNRQIVMTGNMVTPFQSLRGFPRITEADLRQVESSIQEGLHRCQNIVYNALKTVVTAKASRENGLSWIASVIILNDLRTSALLQNDSQVQACCTDAYMLNFCGMLLQFFLPIYGDQSKLSKIDLNYSISDACRLNYDFETCLASGQIVSERSQDRLSGRLPPDLQSQHNFISECFHLCQRALSVGVIPAVVHYNRMQRDLHLKIEALAGSPQQEQVKNQHVLLTLMWDTCLCDEELVRSVTMFYLSQAQLLLKLLQTAGQDERMKAEKKAFSKIPEFCVKDMAVWFRFVATHAVYVHKGVLQGLPISRFVDCCVSLLERPDLMPGPIPASKMVSCLLQFLRSSRNVQSRGWGSGVMSELATMVETCPSVQHQLGPALLRTYISVDVVEGLDVDKDEFDKYSARSEIGTLIEHLWRRSDSRRSIVEQCEKDFFQNFLGAILDTLLYMLHDSLSRLANIKKIEVAKQNEQEWNSLPMQDRIDKENFLRNEEHVAKGFMGMANQTLEFIDLLTKAEEVARCFTKAPLSVRAASVICGFLEALCGSKAKDFKVKDFDKYNFNPQKLLLQIVNIVLRVAREVTPTDDSFLVSMATNADFDASNFEKAYSVISSKSLSEEELLKQFDELTQKLKTLHQERQAVQSADRSSDHLLVEELDKITVDVEKVVEVYTRCMSGSRLTTSEIQDSHSYLSNLQSLDARSPKIKYLLKEMKLLQRDLPIHPDATICVVQDEERIDVMRALVTGPVGTPYSLGCFVFDVYFPASYPNSAPLVKIITTGGGTVRFNPNLYSDGKVCLSLLGTWHGGDSSEKWNPGKSTIYQVLVSIQSLILIPEPMFNEPGYEGRKGSADKESFDYNWKIRLNTLRHAILGQLRNPPPGLEKIIRRHFAIQKECVRKQCREWLAECEDGDQMKRMRQVITGICTELKDLQVEEDEEKEEGDDEDI